MWRLTILFTVHNTTLVGGVGVSEGGDMKTISNIMAAITVAGMEKATEMATDIK